MSKRIKTTATLHFDGACKGNPGPGGGGWIISDETKTLGYGWQYFEDCTNNIAEYQGLINGLKFALDKNIKNLEIRGDSKLVMMQLLGKWKVKAVHLKPLYLEAEKMFKKMDANIKWIPREENGIADLLSNIALKEKDLRVEGENEELIDALWLKNKF